MDTPLPNKSWNALLTDARKVAPPAAIDVRAAVRRQIENEPRTNAPVSVQPNVWDELLALARLRWVQGALASSALAALVFLVAGISVTGEVLRATEFAGPLFDSL